MIAHMRLRIAPFREGQGVRARVAFTRGACVGYNAHHEGVRHVARCAAVMAAKGRGPPAGTGEPLPCSGRTIYSDRRWCLADKQTTRATNTEAAAPTE